MAGQVNYKLPPRGGFIFVNGRSLFVTPDSGVFALSAIDKNVKVSTTKSCGSQCINAGAPHFRMAVQGNATLKGNSVVTTHAVPPGTELVLTTSASTTFASAVTIPVDKLLRQAHRCNVKRYGQSSDHVNVAVAFGFEGEGSGVVNEYIDRELG
jgi:hypothetical protein